MADLNLKQLIGKLNPTCHRALEAAAGLCLSRTNFNVEIEHWLMKLNEDANSDFRKIFAHFEVNPDRVSAGLTKALDKQKTGNSRTPAISTSIVEAITNAWLFSSIDFGLRSIRSGAVLLAVLSHQESAFSFAKSLPEFARIDADMLKRTFFDIVGGSSEDAESRAVSSGESATGDDAGRSIPGSKTPSLDQFTNDLTANARAGKIDPVLGRDFEIRQVIDILTRRRQNNPILTGEAGVGKTAVVEGFALRIAAGDVPPPLKNVSLRTLDLALLQAGAGIKGEFENRLKSVIEEVKASPSPIILFIDEAHTMIGAGGQAGQGDAANLLKPALARGELRTIAATTWAEYKKYFDKDAALARRFQVVKVEEPSEDAAILMMRGLTHTLQKHHNVDLLDEAVEASVKLSARYISGRQLPDKSVSLLDTACARVALSQSATPSSLEDARRRLHALQTELSVLQHEAAAGGNHSARLAEIETMIAETKTNLEEIETRWNREKELVQKIRDSRAKLREQVNLKSAASENAGKPTDGKEAQPAAAAQGDKQAVVPLSEPELQALQQSLDSLNKELKEYQGERPLLQVCVDGQTVAEVISAWTGIPVGRMVADQIQTVLNLHKHLGERIIGQDHALHTVARRIRTSRAGMDDPQKPVGVFMLVGPSGVGKTETAIALADMLYGGERNMVTINMSEYQEAHTVSGLKGSPPGYVGFGEGGVLTEAVRRKPYSVVLLDEVEKAHPDVMELFFQVFDKGVLEDSEGREIDFKNTVILLTSNVGTNTVMKLTSDPAKRPDSDSLAKSLRPELEKAFPAALLGRLVVVPYYPIADDVMKQIVKLKLNRIVKRVQQNHGVPMTYDDALVGLVAKRCTEVASGARNVDNILTNTLLPELAQEFLARMAENRPCNSIHVSADENEQFAYSFT